MSARTMSAFSVFMPRCCFIFPFDTPISMLRCAKYKFISKSEASRKAMSEEAFFHRVRSNLSPCGVSFPSSPAVKMRALRKSPAFRIVCRDFLIQFSCFLSLSLPLFSEISFPSVCLFCAVSSFFSSSLSLSVYHLRLSLRL